MKYVVFICRTIKILISNWPRKLKFSQFLQAGKTVQLLLTFLTKFTGWSRCASNFYGQNLTGKFMRKIYAVSVNLFTDSWSWQSFVPSCDVLNCRFWLDVQNEIQLLSRFFCYSWLVCLLGFWLRNTSLVNVIGNPISGWHHFQTWAYSLHLASSVRGVKSPKRFWPYLMALRTCISTGKHE